MRSRKASLLLPLCAALCLLLAACGGTVVHTVAPPLETEGPPLAIYGEYTGMELQGSMERSCMTGYGTLTFAETGPTTAQATAAQKAAAQAAPPQRATPGTSGKKNRSTHERQSSVPEEEATPDGTFSCQAKLDAPPTRKGRVRGLITCTGGRVFAMTLRNTGPDQGIGVAREKEGEDMMVFFYHASAEEAKRRFPKVAKEIAQARRQTEKRK